MSGATPQYGTGQLPVAVDPTAWYGRNFTPTAPIDVGTILTELNAQLVSFFNNNSALSTISVYEWPNYDLDTWWESSSPAFVVIAYSGTRFSKPLDTNTMLQERTLEFDFYILARQIAWAAFTGPGSPFIIVDSIEAAMSGYRPTGCRNSYLVDERFTEQRPDGRIWLYKMRLNVVTMRVKLAASYVLANASQITNMLGVVGNQTTSTYTVTNGGLTLPVNNIVSSVVDTTTKKVYVQGVDYLVSFTTGLLTLIPGGSLTNTAQVKVTTMPTETITQTGT